MDVFTIIAQVVFYVCMAVSIGMLIFYFIKRALVRKKIKKEILEDEENSKINESSKN